MGAGRSQSAGIARRLLRSHQHGQGRAPGRSSPPRDARQSGPPPRRNTGPQLPGHPIVGAPPRSSAGAPLGHAPQAWRSPNAPTVACGRSKHLPWASQEFGRTPGTLRVHVPREQGLGPRRSALDDEDLAPSRVEPIVVRRFEVLVLPLQDECHPPKAVDASRIALESERIVVLRVMPR